MRASQRAYRRFLAGLLLGVAAAACGRGPRSDVSDSTFVATMAELRRVQQDTATDIASRAAARARVLQGRGLTAARLEQAARALAADPERANRVFQAIARKSSQASVAAPRTMLPGTTRPATDSGPEGPTRRRLRGGKGGRFPTR